VVDAESELLMAEGLTPFKGFDHILFHK